MSAPSACTARMVHDLTATPSTRMVHAHEVHQELARLNLTVVSGPIDGHRHTVQGGLARHGLSHQISCLSSNFAVVRSDEPTSLKRTLPIGQHLPIVRKGELGGQRLEPESPYLAHLVTIWTQLAVSDFAGVHHQYDRRIALRIHPDQAGQSNRSEERR